MNDTHERVVRGVIADVSEHPDHGRAEVTLTIECEDGVTFEESYDCSFNQARASEFMHAYGVSVPNSEGREVNVLPKIGVNPRHTVKKLPVATVGGDIHVPEDADLPVPM